MGDFPGARNPPPHPALSRRARSTANLRQNIEERGSHGRISRVSVAARQGRARRWEHRSKVAVAGVGHSPVDRRWDDVSMDETVGAYSILACRKAMDDAGVTPDQIDGVICFDGHIAGGSGGSASQWAPRPYFAPPYDSEWGLTLVNAQWLIAQMRLPNVKFAPTGVPTISEMVGMAAQAVGDGLCHTCLVIYPTGNLEGRYRRGGENADDYARGARQWTAPWGNHGGNDFINIKRMYSPDTVSY